MRLLLDTHALIWMLGRSPRLSSRAAIAIDAPDNDVLVSAVSAYEIFLKHKLGKLTGVEALIAGFEREITFADCTPLPVTLAHAETAGKLAMDHRDPFDRILIAQALVERIAIVSNEAVFDAYGVERIW